MAATIRLMRFGKKKNPFYRIVVLDKSKKAKGSYIEVIGTYDPMTEPVKMTVKKDRLDYWKSVGVQESDGYLKIAKHFEATK